MNDWVDVARRARLGPTVKLVAFVMASRADADGTKVFPGIARMAVECEVDYSTVRRALAALRNAGLVEVVRRGARRSGKSDEYRLIIAEDLLDRCDVPTPDEQRAAIGRLTEKKQHRSTAHPRPVEPPVHNSDHSSPVSCRNGSTAHTAPVLQLTGELPPSLVPVPELQPPSDAADEGSKRSGGTRASDRDDTDLSPSGRQEAERCRQADALTAWELQQSEAVAAP